MFNIFKELFGKAAKELGGEKPEPSAKTELTREAFEDAIGQNTDVKIRRIDINDRLHTTLIFIDGMTNEGYVSDFVLRPLLSDPGVKSSESYAQLIERLSGGLVYFSSVIKTDCFDKALREILSGGAALLFEESGVCFIYATKGYDKRSVVEPSSENVTKGSKDSFVETLRTNTATIRRKIRSPELCIDTLIVGRRTQTNIAVIYMKSIANPRLTEDVKKRIASIDIDSAVSSGPIEESITRDNKTSFPLVLSTERPEKFCADLLEGRIGVIIDGLPNAIIVPCTLLQLMQVPEDYSRNFINSSIIRLFRYSALVLSLMAPGFYVAITSFHPEMIPTSLAVFIAQSHNEISFPIAIETFMLLMVLGILLEASLRIPKSIGSAVSIVGTLIIGQSAVTARLVSPVTVIVASMVAISAYAMSNLDMVTALRSWRFFILLLSSLLGLFGLFVTIQILVYHLCRLESFGVPYLSPYVAGEDDEQFADTLLRLPFRMNRLRPKILEPLDRVRRTD